MGHALYRRGASADDGHALVPKLLQGRAEGIAPGVVVIPAAGVEGMALKTLDARDTRQLRHVQGPRPHAQIFCCEAISPVGLDLPNRAVLEPLEILHFRVKQGVIVEIILTPDALALGQNLGGVGILLRGPVARFLQQRHVDHGRRIALGPGVAIPVPGAAEVAALLEDAHIRDARLLQPGARHQAREAPSDKSKGDVVGLGCPLNLWDVGIREVVREGAAREPPILLITIGAQALIPLLPIPFPKGCAIHEGSSPQAVSDLELTRGAEKGKGS